MVYDPQPRILASLTRLLTLIIQRRGGSDGRLPASLRIHFIGGSSAVITACKSKRAH
jgi:hypothetical protein